MQRSTSGTSSEMSTTPSPCVGVVGDERAVGADRALEDEPDRAGLEHERLVVAGAVLGAGVGDELHAPGALVVVRGLGGVADDEDEGVPAGDGERVLLLVVLDEADELLELLEVQARLALLLGEVEVAGRRRGRVSHPVTVRDPGTVCNGGPLALVRLRTVLPQGGATRTM